MKRNIFLTLLVFCLLIGCLFLGFSNLEKTEDDQDYLRVEESIRKTVMACYAIEGSYPEDIEYLKENYGLYFNDELYQVHFRYLGGNIMPEYKVFLKGNR